jgi:processive 1,2-diacylglycerol beta-glucosyltransferase
MTEIVEQTLDTLTKFEKKQFNLLVVCGKNEKARAQISALQFPQNVSSKVFGFVSNIHELMDASDVVITKAGGLTSSEALAKGLPLIIVDPIPGQESRNTDIITEYGTGWKAINLANLGYKLHRILDNPSLLSQARKATQQLAKPQAAATILNEVYHQIQS